ncbi:MAG TPA: energy transducer TonB [Longimicrobiales bacterium]|nr:energy transducer TonB [Longimicrobiales bacterium]
MKRAIGFVAALLLVWTAAAAWLTGGEEVALTEPVVFSVDSPFRYPIALWDRRVEGETVLMVHVTDRGRVDSAYVLVSSGEVAFDSAALDGARELRFAPARRGQEPVSLWARLPVRFRMAADSAEEGEGEA